MYKNGQKNLLVFTIFIIFLGFSWFSARAQFTLTGQIRDRAELRKGFGNLVPIGASTAGFLSQRTRLNFGYKGDLLNIGVTIQDVRVFGADASSISLTDNRLALHEAWAELILANRDDSKIKFKILEHLSLKIGRQELIYDDSRLIGNLDWLQQGRTFDMALFKILEHGWQVDLGYAFNQNSDAFGITNSEYIPGNLPAYVKNSQGNLVPVPSGLVPLASSGSAGNNSSKLGNPVYTNPPSTNGATQDYKSFTSFYISKKWEHTKFSALFFNDNFGQYHLDSSGNATSGYVYGRRFVQNGVTDLYDYSPVHRYTFGLMWNQSLGDETRWGLLSLQTAYYQQSGSNRDNIPTNGHHFTVALTYQKSHFSFTPGYDILSGNDATAPNGKDNRFDPLYGTPHKFWGYLDYFYAGTGSPAGGLNNPYFKVKYATKSFLMGLDLHYFSLNKDMKRADGTVIDKNLGTELDFTTNYAVNRFTNVEFGYGIMLATNSLPYAKAQASTDLVSATYNKTGNWAYIMLKFTPDFLFKPSPSK